jgi:hypothetical protein
MSKGIIKIVVKRDENGITIDTQMKGLANFEIIGLLKQALSSFEANEIENKRKENKKKMVKDLIETTESLKNDTDSSKDLSKDEN